MFRTAGIFLIVVCTAIPSPAQNPDSSNGRDWFAFTPSSPLDFLLPYFPPYLLHFTNELKDFVRSRDFSRIRKESGDVRSIDAIYVRAMDLTGDNAAMALLISCLATFDHDIVGLRVPVLSIALPLTGESTEEFRQRIRNLPVRLYDDTPPSGDRDKIQHFFGSAFLSCTFESRDAADRFGEFIEESEDAVIIGGAIDDRDRRANRQGQEFGLALIADNHRYPSEFLRTTIAGQTLPGIDTPECESER
jgi:hypothetical protein